ncbi:uncharacterized protein [Littorina saxatilis]|uniref:uncharacterized protein n=1 Tax=Littorina saxatilis TaxID=31220 RepID=UPI0038B65872
MEDYLPVPQLPPLPQEFGSKESLFRDQLRRSSVKQGEDRSMFSSYRRARKKQNGQRRSTGGYNQFSPLFGPRSFFFEASNEPRHSLFRTANTTTFQGAAYQFFLKLLCPQQMKDAEKLRFNAAKFVADIDNNFNFVVEKREGNSLSDRAILKLPDWLSEATSGYRESLDAAFAMFDLLDMDRSGYLSRLDFTHWLIDTDMNGAVSVCEEMSHVNKVARLAEYYGNSVLRKQGRFLWNSLYDQNFAPSPVVQPEVPPTPSSIADVTVNSNIGSEQGETNEMGTAPATTAETNQPLANNISSSKNHSRVASEPPLSAEPVSEYTTQQATTEEASPQPQQGQSEQEMTSSPPLEETTTAAPVEGDDDDLDLVVRGLFKFIG